MISHLTIAGLYNVEPLWSILKWSPLKIFWSGHQAVILFFVLSGFALTKMWQSSQNQYGTYILARVARLYFPYIASIILAFCTYAVFQHFVTWTAGWMNVPSPQLASTSILGHLTMVGAFNTAEINPPIWSIVHEMRISIVFPLVYIAVARGGARSLMGFVLLSILVSWAISGPIPLSPIQAELLISVHYVTFFAFGSFIAMQQAALCGQALGASKKVRAAIWVLALVLYAYPFDNPWTLSERMIGDLFIGVGSFLIIVLILSGKQSALLRHSSYLGKISYSLYLNHILAVNLALLIFYQHYGSFIVWIVALPLAIAISAAMYRVTEAPSINLSRRIRRTLSARIPISQTS